MSNNKKKDYEKFVETVNGIVDGCPEEDREAIAEDLKELYLESEEINKSKRSK